MSQSIPLEFPMTPARWEVLRARFTQESGVEVPDETSGEIISHGVECRFTYDGITLRLTITDKPWYASESTVVSRITAFINQV